MALPTDKQAFDAYTQFKNGGMSDADIYAAANANGFDKQRLDQIVAAQGAAMAAPAAAVPVGAPAWDAPAAPTVAPAPAPGGIIAGAMAAPTAAPAPSWSDAQVGQTYGQLSAGGMSDDSLRSLASSRGVSDTQFNTASTGWKAGQYGAAPAPAAPTAAPAPLPAAAAPTSLTTGAGGTPYSLNTIASNIVKYRDAMPGATNDQLRARAAQEFGISGAAFDQALSSLPDGTSYAAPTVAPTALRPDERVITGSGKLVLLERDTGQNGYVERSVGVVGPDGAITAMGRLGDQGTEAGAADVAMALVQGGLANDPTWRKQLYDLAQKAEQAGGQGFGRAAGGLRDLAMGGQGGGGVGLDGKRYAGGDWTTRNESFDADRQMGAAAAMPNGDLDARYLQQRQAVAALLGANGANSSLLNNDLPVGSLGTGDVGEASTNPQQGYTRSELVSNGEFNRLSGDQVSALVQPGRAMGTGAAPTTGTGAGTGAGSGGTAGSGGIINGALGGNGLTRWDVTPDQTVEGRISRLTDPNNPVTIQARTRALQSANARGLINSSMAISASDAAAYDAAIPIATADAATFAKAAGYNADQPNQQLTLDKQLASQKSLAELNASTSLKNAQIGANTSLSTAQLNAETQKAIAKLNNEQQTQAASMSQANQTLLNTNSQAAAAFNQAMVTVGNINNNAALDASNKTQAVSNVYNQLQQQLKVLSRTSGLNLDLSFAGYPGFDAQGNFTGNFGAAAPAPAPPGIIEGALQQGG